MVCRRARFKLASICLRESSAVTGCRLMSLEAKKMELLIEN